MKCIAKYKTEWKCPRKIRLKQLEQNQGEGIKETEIDMDVQDELSSISDTHELMGETDIDEESVNISTASTSSHSTEKKERKVDLNLTDADGKLDLSKIKRWLIPKLNKTYRAEETSRVGG